ncbi:uncharacterized protein LOC143045003 [Mytilus galloprovincialis]|uniref:uncharacterized protein LOC143045003 n=1 Tax=Mytilus galloprovincialis TaxID=29158 RepID=UPI003F7C4BC0
MQKKIGMPAGMNPATERRSVRVKERVLVSRTKTRPDREPSRNSITARRPTKKNNPPVYTRNQILQNAVQPPDVNLNEISTSTTSNDGNDDIRTSINTLSKAVSDLKDHLTSVSDTVKSLKEQSDSSIEDQIQQQNTVQDDIMDEPRASSHQTGATTEQRQNNYNLNGTITHIGTNNSNNMYDSPSYLENVPFTQTTNNTFQSALPVGATVSDEIKGKIWANEYINFDILLPEDDMIDKPIPLSVERDNQNQPRLVFNESTGSKKIRTIDQWISAFSAYMVIYCQKFTDAFEDLITYMETVREIAKSNGQWLKYDKKFRKAKCQLRVSWANMQ